MADDAPDGVRVALCLRRDHERDPVVGVAHAGHPARRERHRLLRADQMPVEKGDIGHLLLDPALSRDVGGDKLRAVTREHVRLRRLEILFPVVADERVEGRRAPVERPVGRLDLEDDGPLPRPVEAAVVRVPDVADADGAVRLRVQVPGLPVQELVLGHRRARGQAERAGDDECARDRRRIEGGLRPGPAAGQDDERAGEDQAADRELAASPEERPRPAGAERENEDGEQRPPCRQGEGEQQAEGEEREQDGALHARVAGRVEREVDVVELPCAVPQPRDHTARSRERRADGEPRSENERQGDGRDPEPAAGHQGGRERDEGEQERVADGVRMALDPQPRDDDRGRGQDVDRRGSGPTHAPPPTAIFRRARPRGRRRLGARRPECRPPVAVRAPAGAAGRRPRRRARRAGAPSAARRAGRRAPA